mgnify:CR=1 FL=1
MKRGIILLLTLLFLIVIPYLNSEEVIGTGRVITGDTTITGGTVTGEITEASVTITIAITGVPFLTIIKPLNQTYFENDTLRLKVNTNTNDMWYNLDDGTNITFTDEVLFNTSEGGHTIYVFANNSFGTTTKNVTFTVDGSLYEIIHENYKDANKGVSTNFSEFSFTEIQNLSDVALENTLYGKIIFNDAINVTDDADTTDSETDLDTSTNISFNRIEVDSIALPNFNKNVNKNATLYLYNLTFSNPRILKDGAVCLSTVCAQNSYSGGTLSFNVTGFTVYSAEETPEEEIVPPPSGVGVGGGGLIFTTSVDEISISLKQGDVKTKEITISNLGNNKLSFSVYSDIEEFVKINQENFQIGPKEKKTIIIDFIARENTIPELYLGNLFIEALGVKKIIPITIEVESKVALFDISIEIPERFLDISPGEELLVKIDLHNLVSETETNIDLEYIIKDINGNIMLTEGERISVEGRKTFEKLIKIPEDIGFGRYVLYVRLVYDNTVASSSAWFNVEKKFNWFETRKIEKVLLIIFTLVVIFIIIYKNKRIQRFFHNMEKLFLRKAFIKKESLTKNRSFP